MNPYYWQFIQFIARFSPDTIGRVIVGIFVVIILGGILLAEKDSKKTKTAADFQTYYPVDRKFRLVLAGGGLLTFVVTGILSYVYRDSLDIHGGFILLLGYLITLTAVLIISFIERDRPYSIFYIIRHFSQAAWVAVLFCVIYVLCIYTYAQCTNANLPFSLSCVVKTFGR